ncbi:hypothetical protein NHX12_007374 [Muraenolepis orangiensis]|uniref:Uncharacterized protein n=1 Tax=Muraenolepis orangiensis TaxID=630683 RepID=A0A9Q0DR83_9TELE|nr:hypothetical protein NHX12_007374 [Muraenolepis orangiensis]
MRPAGGRKQSEASALKTRLRGEAKVNAASNTASEIIDIPSQTLPTAQWQMESLSGKRNGSSGAAGLFSPSAWQAVTFLLSGIPPRSHLLSPRHSLRGGKRI